MRRLLLLRFCMTLAALFLAVEGTRGGDPPAARVEVPRDPALAASLPLCFSHSRFNIATMKKGQVQVLTTGNRDFKPISSPDGKTLVFFRVRTFGDGTFETWRTALYVVNTDGSGLRQMTSGDYTDYNPTFMRDGSNRIAFNRYNRIGWRTSEIYLTSPDAKIGAEQRVSHPTVPAYEWVHSSLKDGRLFIHRIQSEEREVYLLTPIPGSLGKYERVQMPSNHFVHKVCISPITTCRSPGPSSMRSRCASTTRSWSRPTIPRRSTSTQSGARTRRWCCTTPTRLRRERASSRSTRTGSPTGWSATSPSTRSRTTSSRVCWDCPTEHDRPCSVGAAAGYLGDRVQVQEPAVV